MQDLKRPILLIFKGALKVEDRWGQSHLDIRLSLSLSLSFSQPLALSLSITCLQASSISPTATAGLCLTCLRKWLWCLTDRHANTHTVMCTVTVMCTRTCTHIPDTSLDWVTRYSRWGFSDVSVCQVGGEINLWMVNVNMSRKHGRD